MNLKSKTLNHLILAASLGLTVLTTAILSTGCAGTRYERSTGESIDDTVITARVKGALAGDSMYKYPDVKVTTFKGTVQLSGFVQEADQKAKAADIAKRVEGVKEVQNHITVKSS